MPSVEGLTDHKATRFERFQYGPRSVTGSRDGIQSLTNELAVKLALPRRTRGVLGLFD